MIAQAKKSINEALGSIRTVIAILAVICGGVWWQAYETSTTRSNIEQLFVQQAEMKEEIQQTKESVNQVGLVLRDYDGRIIRLEEFRNSF